MANDVDFASSEVASSADRPRLDIYYDNLTGSLPNYQFEQEEQLTDRLAMRVNVANGNLLLEERDLMVAGTGPALDFTRFYNTREPVTSTLGWGWSESIGQSIGLSWLGDESIVMMHGPTGWVKAFRKQADGTYKKPDGVNATLSRAADGTWVLKWNKTDVTWRLHASTGLLTRIEDRNGNSIAFTHDASNKLSEITDTQGRVTRFAYNANGRIASMTDSAGRVHTYAYNTASTGPEVSPGLLLTSYTDPAGKVTTYSYGGVGGSELTSVTDPRGKVTSFTYDGDRRITSVTRGGHRTNLAYAQAGTRCGDGQNTVVTDPRGNKTTYCWDDRGRVDEVYDALGRKRSRQYDSNSNVTDLQGPGGAAGSYSTKAAYDSRDNLTSVEEPGGALSSFSYGTGSEAFKLKESSNPQGSRRNFNYDAAGDLTKIGTTTSSGAAETLVEIQYNGKSDGSCADQSGVPKGTIRCSIDGNDNRTTYDHDTKGNLTKIMPPAPLGSVSYTYDGLSRPTTMTDGKGQKRSFTYDARDRMTKVEFRRADGTLESTVSYAYDANGNLTSRTDAVGTSSFSYDDRNLLTEEVFPGGHTNRYAYDGAKNLVSFTDVGGQVLYTYNPVNLLAELTEPGGGRTTYAYNDDNSRVRMSLPNGVTETRTYTQAERVKTIQAKNASGTVLTDFAYDFQRGSRESHLIQKMTDGQRGTTTTYGYDHLDRLNSQNTMGAVSESYSYRFDRNSNRLESSDSSAGPSKSYAYDQANQLCWVFSGSSANGCSNPPSGATTYHWDANGNLTSSSDGYRYTYNAQNQTNSIAHPGGAPQEIRYLDVGQTEMIQRGTEPSVNNRLGPGQSLSRQDQDFYTREPGGAYHSRRNGSSRHYYLLDAHPGSVAAMTDSTGGVTVRYRYDPFGQDKGQTGTLSNALRFASAEWASSLKLYKLGERWYDPKLGRFTQQDPLNQPFDPRQSNRYPYAGQDPVNLTDPTGTTIFEDAIDFVGDTYETSRSEVGKAVRKYTYEKFEKAAECGLYLGGSGTGDCDPLDYVFPDGVEDAY